MLIRLALKIRPVKLNKSIYVRVPNDIADLIGVDGQTDVTLRLQDAGDEFYLVYAIRKGTTSTRSQLAVAFPDQRTTGTTGEK